MSQLQCRIVQTDSQVELHAPAFTYALDLSTGLRGISWFNALAGRSIDLADGPEFDVDLDRAEQRIGITGWRGGTSTSRSSNPDDDTGCWDGYHQPGYDDRSWAGM